MKSIFITLLLLLSISTFSQDNEVDTLTTYTISSGDKPQVLTLAKLSNGKYVGNLKTDLFKGKYQTRWLGRFWTSIWNRDTKVITDNYSINEDIVEHLMIGLKNDGIETIKDCSLDQDCNNLKFLDGSTILIKIETKEIHRNYGFADIYPISNSILEKIEYYNQIQKLMTTLYSHIDLKKEFGNTFNRIPRGAYHIWSGNGIMNLSNNKHLK